MKNKIYFVGNTNELIPSDLYEKTTIQECATWLNTLEEVNLDTETEGLFNFKNKILMLQLSWKDISYVIDVRYTNILPLKKALESILVVGQNLKFDYKFLKLHGVELNNIYDTLLAECCLTNGLENRELGLAHLALKYCNITLNKSVRSQFSNIKGQPFTEQQIVYGVQDVTCLTEIKTKQLLKAVDKDVTKWLCNEMDSCLALADIEYSGMGFNEAKWIELAKKAISNVKEYYKVLDILVKQDPKLSKYVKSRIQANMFVDIEEGFTHEREINIKWSSPLQVLEVFKTLGLKLKSTNEKEISKYQKKYPLIKAFIDYKKQQKLESTYGLAFLEHINPITKRIHTSFWQIAETSRVTSGSKRDNTPNMQNIPAKEEYRNCFIARPGFTLVSCDFAGQELRLCAEGSKEPLWVNAYLSGEDLHSNVASKVFEIPLDKVTEKPVFLRGKSYRDAAKTINFGLLYGMTEHKLSDQLSISLIEADKIIKDYFKSVPALNNYLEKCRRYGISKKYIRSFKPYSIIRYFEECTNNTKEMFAWEGAVERASMNTPIQASGAQMIKRALYLIRKYIKDNLLHEKVYIIMTVHDQIDCEVEESFAKEWSLIQEKLMRIAGEEFIKSIPVKSDITISKIWTKE